ncbi:hypothetical protein ABW21_db0201171 [Orbilia brochopaga]|nr:hypothetical protein ABW21_db0201171 [Drechslerella brochopaga]
MLGRVRILRMKEIVIVDAHASYRFDIVAPCYLVSTAARIYHYPHQHIRKHTRQPPKMTISTDITAAGPFKFLPQGAIVQEWMVGGRNIVLGFKDPAEYAKSNPAFFGATIGRASADQPANRIRIANRLANGQIKDIPNEGDTHPLPVNDGPNTLHGGNSGWDKKYWTGPVRETSKDGAEVLVYSYRSPHLDEQFPGALDVSVRYTVKTEKKDEVDVSVLEIEFEAQVAPDSPEDWAIVSMTNHR